MDTLPHLDTERRERESRDRMIRDGLMPSPSGPVAQPSDLRAEADPLDHRRWFLLDANGARRFVCFWKDCGYEPARGGASAVEDDGIVRRWEGRDSEHFYRTMKLRLHLRCARCTKREGYTVEIDARGADEHSADARAFVEHHEREFRAKHVCEHREAARFAPSG